MTAHNPLQLGPLKIRNRFIKTATFEGMSAGGLPTPDLTRHHARLAAGGVGLTTVAYGAVDAGGRTFGDQLLIDETSLPGLTSLAEAVHAHGGAVSLQLAHCGGFSKHVTPYGPSRAVNPYGIAYGLPLVRRMDPERLAAVVQQFVRAAQLARRAGIDAVEVHAGHGYLLSQFLSPLINRRRDGWGGSREGRSRLPVQVVRAVLEAVGDDLAVLVKVNTSDGLAGGQDVHDAIDLGERLQEVGAHALVLSGGLVQRNAFFLLRGGTPLAAMAANESSWLQRISLRAFAPLLIRGHTYSPLFFLEDSLRMREALDLPLILLGGVDSAQAVRKAMASGFEGVAMGRALIHDPDAVQRIRADVGWSSDCNHCNRCVAEMEAGVRCHEPGGHATEELRSA